MAHHTSWKQLGVGLVASCAIIGAVVAVLVYARVGMLHGKKFRFYVTIDAARGVIRGTEVWLDGQKVGLVAGVAFRPPTVGRSERLVLALDVLEEARPLIRADSRAQVQAGLSLIGDQVVALSSGTATQRGIASGDTLRFGAQADMESIASEAALASREFPGIIENVKLLAAQLRSAEGTIGAIGALNASSVGGDTSRADFARIRAKTERLMTRLTDSRGTLGLALGARGAGGGVSSLGLRERANRAMAQADSIRALLASDQHSLGRFRRDSTIVLEIGRVRDEIARVQRLAADSGGTIGRLRADSAFTRGIARDLAGLDSVLADIKRHPFRYIVF